MPRSQQTIVRVTGKLLQLMQPNPVSVFQQRTRTLDFGLTNSFRPTQGIPRHIRQLGEQFGVQFAQRRQKGAPQDEIIQMGNLLMQRQKSNLAPAEIRMMLQRLIGISSDKCRRRGCARAIAPEQDFQPRQLKTGFSLQRGHPALLGSHPARVILAATDGQVPRALPPLTPKRSQRPISHLLRECAESRPLAPDQAINREINAVARPV